MSFYPPGSLGPHPDDWFHGHLLLWPVPRLPLSLVVAVVGGFLTSTFVFALSVSDAVVAAFLIVEGFALVIWACSRLQRRIRIHRSPQLLSQDPPASCSVSSSIKVASGARLLADGPSPLNRKDLLKFQQGRTRVRGGRHTAKGKDLTEKARLNMGSTPE